jgi:hypothetical protein
MKCSDCAYHFCDIEEYIDETGETRYREIGTAYCHYFSNDGYAPCELD